MYSHEKQRQVEFLICTLIVVDTCPFLSPETILILRALSTFEALYLSRSGNRLNEVVAQAVAGGARTPPGMTEGVNVARIVANELDSAKFDPLLIVNVAKKAQASLETLLSRIEPLVSAKISMFEFKKQR